MQDSATVLSTRRERVLLWLLAGLQFTHLLDFMILSPLAPQFMRLWGITASQFGYLVSVYALAAAVAGLGATFVIDRFDRRAVLLTVYALFVLATVACALAPGYWWLMVARALAGASGGIVGSVVMAIIGDLIPAERRGRAMGVVLSAFPLVSVLGVPVSLLLANHLGWHAPFFTLAAISFCFWPASAAWCHRSMPTCERSRRRRSVRWRASPVSSPPARTGVHWLPYSCSPCRVLRSSRS